jgi:ribosomal protein S18 acetylase RimI-like enzyme
VTTLRVLSAEQFAPWVDDAAAVYGEAMQRDRGTVAARRDLIGTHLGHTEFAAVTSFDDDDVLVGFGYGYRGTPGHWWHDVVATALGRDRNRQWLTDTFELAELHVLPAQQGQGIGRAIIESLLSTTGAATVVLSTHDRESPARALYRSLGFIDLLLGFRFPGSAELYAVMGLDRR